MKVAIHSVLFSLAVAALALAPSEGAPANTPPPPAQAFRYTGPGSCSSSSCHGSVTPREQTRINQNEYSIWVVEDKHSRAYSVLSNPVSVRMARLLDLPAAEQAPKCLACHALNVPAEQQAQTFELSDGVSCESCHGPAAAWLGPHTRRDWSHEQSVARGMYDTKNLVKRAEKCLSCHLGNEEKYVDHTMIAAGHPDLVFELDTFSAVMPRHWKPRTEEDPWRNVRIWGTNQAVMLREALRRLARWAERPVWPEYAEYECFACHHALPPAEKSWRQERGYPRRPAGSPPWNVSRYIVFRVVARMVDPERAEELASRMQRLQRLMNHWSPDRKALQEAARATARVVEPFGPQLASYNFNEANTLRLLREIAREGETIAREGERAAEQAAMALESLFLACKRNTGLRNEAEVRQAIDALFRELENPSYYNAETFARQMRTIHRLLR